MKFMHMRFVLLCLIHSLLGFNNAYAAPNGEQLYSEHCMACHGTKGAGGIGLPLGAQTLGAVTDDYIYKTVRHGRPGRIMPAYPALSDAQINALIAYLRSWAPQQEIITKAATGDMGSGEILYEKHCVSCHGKDGSGGEGTGVTFSRPRNFSVIPPAINNPGFLKAASDSVIRHTINKGRLGANMPAFSEQLSAQEIDDIIIYVRSFENQQSKPAPTKGPASLIFPSPYDYETTVQRVREALKGNNFRVFGDRFLEQGLSGFEEQRSKNTRIRFCNFKNLYGMLGIDPRLGILLPCGLTVVENDDGSVDLIAMNVNAIVSVFNNDQLTALSEVMLEAITLVVEEATF